MVRLPAKRQWLVILRSGILVLAAVIEVTGAGCSSKSDTGNDPCAPVASKLRSCGLLSEGTYACDVKAGDRDYVDCMQGCFTASDCSTLEGAACSANPAITAGTRTFVTCLSQCNDQYGFQCAAPGAGARGVDPSFVCDGQPDCADGSDEVGCEMFACGDGQQVLQAAFCNGIEDCRNGHDEGDGCEHFTCADGTSVPLSFRCDSGIDCADGSDEAGCGSVAVLQCPATSS